MAFIGHEPLNYSGSFHKHEHVEPEPTPEIVEESILDDDEEIEEWGPDPEPEPVEPAPEFNFSRKSHIDRPQAIVFTSCDWLDDRDERGNFISSCVYCNHVNYTVAAIVTNNMEFTAGPDPSSDFWMVNIETREGRIIDKRMSTSQYSLTQEVTKRLHGRYETGTPLIVVRYPDGRQPLIVEGWPKGLDPKSYDAMWYMASLVGVKKNDPRTWRHWDTAFEAPIDAGVVQWMRSPNTIGWGAKVNVRDVIDWFVAPDGGRELAPGVTLVVPPLFRPKWPEEDSRGRDVIVKFDPPPYVEMGINLISKRVRLTHATVARDSSRITLHSDVMRTTFPIDVQW